MINDTIDILDAKIVNFYLEYSILPEMDVNVYDVLDRVAIELEDYFEMKMDIGEYLDLTELRRVINDTEGVIDLISLRIKNRTGGNYSSVYLDFEENLSKDGKILYVPKNVILELKYPKTDIKGIVR